MTQEQSRFSLILGSEEEEIVQRLQKHLGSRTSKAAAIQYALKEWDRRRTREAADRMRAEQGSRAVLDKIAAGLPGTLPEAT